MKKIILRKEHLKVLKFAKYRCLDNDSEGDMRDKKMTEW
jgi:hypothetical protein